MVYARNKQALTFIQQQFEKQKTRKVYECLVIGKLRGTNGCVNLPICVDWPNRPLQKRCRNLEDYALTRWKRLVKNDTQRRVGRYPTPRRSHRYSSQMMKL